MDEASGTASCWSLADVLKTVRFRPNDGFCTCHDHALHGTCCHLLAAARLAAFADSDLPAACQQVEGTNLLQAINISRQRTFQQATIEPLGEDGGTAELQALAAGRQASQAAIRHAQSNADPEVAQLRQDLAVIQRTLMSLPAGEARDELWQGIKDLRSNAENAAMSAELPLTQVRAGKVTRRQNGRPEGQRMVTALHPGRTHKRSRESLIQQQPQEADCCDEFKPLPKGGRPTHKVTNAPPLPAWDVCHAWLSLPMAYRRTHLHMKCSCRYAAPPCLAIRKAHSSATVLHTTGGSGGSGAGEGVVWDQGGCPCEDLMMIA